MEKTNISPEDWHKLEGEIPFRMTNDYLFRALMQENNSVLSAFIASLLGWKKDDITSATIENPIMLGSVMMQKDFILDVHVLINNSRNINLEMQVLDEHNWPERSLIYLCRVFDDINPDDDYRDIKPAHHIGILSFNLFPDTPEFYATYQLLNVNNFQKYTDKFTLSVLSLSCIDKATAEDKASHLDEWAAMYKARKWEELRMLAQKNPDIDNAVTTMFTLSNEKIVKEQMRAREDYYRLQRSYDRLIKDQEKELAENEKELTVQRKELADSKKELADSKKELADSKKELADHKRQIAEKDKRIAELEAMLASRK